jgi:methylated-DNA-[protein]-cysteine S-methyltransferase
MYYSKTISSPVGTLTLIASDKSLHAILWAAERKTNTKKPLEIVEKPDHPILLETEKQLSEYFKGDRKKFTVPLDNSHGTEFQQKVWTALREIPYGEVRTYGQQAVVINNPKAVRAVGSANGHNPLPIITPCHRVIASNNKLGGYTGGLDIKKTLLELEKKFSNQ